MRDAVHELSAIASGLQSTVRMGCDLEGDEVAAVKVVRERLDDILELASERRMEKLEDAVRELNPGLNL